MQFRFHHGSHRYEEAPIFRKISHTLKADTDQFSCTDHCSTARHASSLLRRLSRTQTLNRFHNLASRLSLSLNPFLNPANHLLRNQATRTRFTFAEACPLPLAHDGLQQGRCGGSRPARAQCPEAPPRRCDEVDLSLIHI